MSEWRSLFDAVSLDGWFSAPRQYGTVTPGGPSLFETIDGLPMDYNERSANHPAVWSVEDGAIVGRQDPAEPGWGGYLISEDAFGDFELELEMKPDWPADTGVMVRRKRNSWEGLQILVDHRASGSIGGFFGNGIGLFHGVPFNIDAALDDEGRPYRLVEDDPANSLEPITPEKKLMLSRAGDVDEFLAAWRWDDWNELRIRCVGSRPLVTTWVNGILVAEIDAATLSYPGYDADTVWSFLGDRGHIAFEVHDNDPRMGPERWARGAACRWRNIRIRES